MADRLTTAIRSLRNLTLFFIAGTAVGAYGAYGSEHAKIEHLESLSDRGIVSAMDIDHNRYRYACIDAAVALDLQQRAIQHDEEMAAALAASEAFPKLKKAKVTR